MLSGRLEALAHATQQRAVGTVAGLATRTRLPRADYRKQFAITSGRRAACARDTLRLRWHDRVVSGENAHRHGPPAHPASLRGAGRRLTRQRQAIWDALLVEPDQHLSAEDVVERVRAELPRVNSSTVYRTLELLVEEGLLLRTDLGGDRAYFEPAREHPHHHLICECCGSVTHIHNETLGNLASRVTKATGYTLGTRELSLFGLCPNCQSIHHGTGS